MRKQAYVLALALLGACSGSEPPAAPVVHASFGIDSSWTRLAATGSAGVLARQAAHLGTGWPTAAHQWFPPPGAASQPAPAPDTALDWQFVVQAPVNVTPALSVTGATPDNANDRMFAYGHYNGADYLGAGRNLYCTAGTGNCPDIAWALPIDSGIDGSAINISIDGSVVYAVSSQGLVYAVDSGTGALLANWPVDVGHAVSWATPWLDFQETPNALYVADTSGNITKIDVSTARTPWSTKVCSAIHASPIVWNHIVWVGCDDGRLYRLDPATGAQYGASTNLGVLGSSNNAIYSGPAIDITNNRLVLGVNNRLIQIDISPTTGCGTGSSSCVFQATATIGSSAIFYSSPFIDVAGGYVYAAFNNRLWRATYTAAGGITGAFDSRALTGKSSNLGYPKSGPMAFNGHVWVGDGGGFINRFSSSTFAFEAATPQYGVSIDTTPVIDVVNGNIYYGTMGTYDATAKKPLNPSNGSWVQLAQTW